MARTFLLALCCAAIIIFTSPSAAQPGGYYLYDGANVANVREDPSRAPYAEWQVWLYLRRVEATEYRGRGLVYARWGVLEGPSAGAVMDELSVLQGFQRSYSRFFGPNAWGPFTLSYTVGPVALAQKPPRDRSELRSRIDLLNGRLSSLTTTLRPSLDNGAPDDQAVMALKEYFVQMRECILNMARLYDRLDRLPQEYSYLNLQLAPLNAAVLQAESGLTKVTAVLPTVKLPVDTSWMSYREQQGNEGMLDVKIAEIGSSTWVAQRWTGGDGSMSGTVILTVIPYQQIGSLDVLVRPERAGARWTIRIGSANRAGFPQDVTSPQRTSGARTYAAVDLQTSERFVYLDFSNPAQAQNAYAFFLYHKQRGL